MESLLDMLRPEIQEVMNEMLIFFMKNIRSGLTVWMMNFA